MAKATKIAVVCTRCRQKRYALPPIPAPYVCKRCQAKPAPAPSPPVRPRETFGNDLTRQRAIDDASPRTRTPWLRGRQRGWLTRWRDR